MTIILNWLTLPVDSLSIAGCLACEYCHGKGNGALGLKNREIIVGKNLLSGVVTQSQATYDRLYERLKKAFQRGTPVRLTIRG